VPLTARSTCKANFSVQSTAERDREDEQEADQVLEEQDNGGRRQFFGRLHQGAHDCGPHRNDSELSAAPMARSSGM
jgi:hypothetical protein